MAIQFAFAYHNASAIQHLDFCDYRDGRQSILGQFEGASLAKQYKWIWPGKIEIGILEPQLRKSIEPRRPYLTKIHLQFQTCTHETVSTLLPLFKTQVFFFGVHSMLQTTAHCILNYLLVTIS